LGVHEVVAEAAELGLASNSRLLPSTLTCPAEALATVVSLAFPNSIFPTPIVFEVDVVKKLKSFEARPTILPSTEMCPPDERAIVVSLAFPNSMVPTPIAFEVDVVKKLRSFEASPTILPATEMCPALERTTAVSLTFPTFMVPKVAVVLEDAATAFPDPFPANAALVEAIPPVLGASSVCVECV